MKPVKNDNLYLNIKNILQSARDNAYRQVNFIMVEAYWSIGQQIVEEEQIELESLSTYNEVR